MLGVHESRVKEYEDKGYVVVVQHGSFVYLENSNDTCLEPSRYGLCLLDKGHSKSHSAVVYYCDGCGKRRRGRPHASNEEVAICFLCAKGII